MQFNASTTAIQALRDNNETDLLLYNGYYDENNRLISSKCIELTEEQLTEIENSGFEGNVYKLYLSAFSFSEQLSDGAKIVPATGFDKYYIRETRGTLQCDEDSSSDGQGI